MVARLSSMVGIALLALAGCASESDGYYSQYPDEAYYGPYSYPYYSPYPYYGGYGAFGYNSGFDRDFDHDFDHRRHRFFRPDDHVTCDRARDLCYDRYGPSYTATLRYLGERDANASFHKYGDKVVLFSPQHGVTCDRRARTCSDAGGFDRKLSQRYFGNAAAPRFLDDEDQARPMERQPDTRMSRSFDQDQAPPLNRKRQAGPLAGPLPDDEDRGQPMLLPQRARPQGMADNDDGDSGPAIRLQQNRPDRPGPAGGGLPRLQNNGGAAAGGGCPPKGCPDK